MLHRFEEKIPGRLPTTTILLTAVVACTTSLRGNDWPMWRYDAYRSASSPHELPDELELAWTREYGQRQQVWDDPLNHDLMPYDKLLEPIVMDGRLFVAFNDRDKVVALDLESGRQLWEFYTDGPVRLPPAAWQGKVYFTSDDGHLYCVGAADGVLHWKLRGGPSQRKVIGNRRIISAWPARGGPVLRDGNVYFAASIWPFMGTFIYALDADSGDVLWVNDSTSAQYIEQPHGAPAFAGVAPQGALVATQGVLLVPGGRSVPAAFDRRTGEFLNFHIGGKGTGGSFVCADERKLYVHTRRRAVREGNLESGEISDRVLNEPVLTDGGTLSFNGSQLVAATRRLEFTANVDASGDLIQAGKRIYAAGVDGIRAVDDSGNVVWSQPVTGRVLRLLAGGGKLIAVTLDGRILVYGPPTNHEPPDDQSADPANPLSEIALPDDVLTRARKLVRRADAADGYALWFDIDNNELLRALLRESNLRVAAVDRDAERVAQLRRELDIAGLYGSRASAHVSDPIGFQSPPYIANLIVIGPSAEQATADGLRTIYQSVRPYGGALWIRVAEHDKERISQIIAEANLPKARIDKSGDGILVVREGPLPGASDWTHQNGDIANTVNSSDRRVQLPLGVLWFGGNSNLDILPRHGHGPPEQVIGGRTFVEGLDSLSARDTYTGRVIWKRTFDDLDTFGVYYDETYRNTPLSVDYNQVHIPGANGRGANYVATEDEVYVVLRSRCVVLDARTGETVRQMEMPPKEPGQAAPLWGFVGIYEDILLGGWGFANYSGTQRDHSSREGLKVLDMSASDGLVAFDRHSGQELWRTDSRYSFIHNGIVAGGGRIYCLDRLPISVAKDLRERGLIDRTTYRILTLDVQTGRPLWEQSEDVFGTWLSYSQRHDILLQAGARGSDRLRDEVGKGLATYRASDGVVIWKDLEKSYSGPCILHNDILLTNVNSYQKSSGAYRLIDGTPHLINNPLTGSKEPLRITRTYGCNAMIASENLLTFRSGAAGFYDLATHSGTGNFGGFRSGCTSNLVIAGGVLNAPDYTRTCTCTYQNQTSLALVHMPDIDLWTNSTFQVLDRIKRVGINLGSPGDRLSSDGTLWLDYPSVGGESPHVDVRVTDSGTTYFRRHTSAIQHGPLPWVMASGARNVESVSVRLSGQLADRTPGIPVAVDHDDAEERSDGSMYLESSDLELVVDDSPQLVGIRFDKLSLPQGDKVVDARIQFTVDEKSSDPAELEIHAVAADHAAPFTSDTYNLSSRALTSASVTWSPDPWKASGTAGEAQRTPNLADVVNEVIGRPGWKRGSALAFVVSGKGQRTARSARRDPEFGPRLVIQPDPALAAKPQPSADGSDSSHPPATKWTVRLYFAEPDDLKVGQRRFDVALQDETVLRDFDVVAQTGGPQRGIVKEFKNILANDMLRIELRTPPGQKTGALLSGVELISEP